MPHLTHFEDLIMFLELLHSAPVFLGFQSFQLICKDLLTLCTASPWRQNHIPGQQTTEICPAQGFPKLCCHLSPFQKKKSLIQIFSLPQIYLPSLSEQAENHFSCTQSYCHPLLILAFPGDTFAHFGEHWPTDGCLLILYSWSEHVVLPRSQR